MISLDAIPDPPAGRRMPARIAHGARDAGLSVRRARRRRRRVPETCMEQCIGKCVDLTQIHKGPVGIWGPGEGGGCCTGSALPHPCALSCTIRDRKRAQSSAPAARHDVLTRSRAHAACSTSIELLARGLMTVGSYWTAPEAMWKRICVPVALTCGIGRGV